MTNDSQMPTNPDDSQNGQNPDNGVQHYDLSSLISFSDVPVDVRTTEQKEEEKRERERKRAFEKQRQEAEERRKRIAEARQKSYQGYDGAPNDDGVFEAGESYGQSIADTIEWPDELQVDWPSWKDQRITDIAHGADAKGRPGGFVGDSRNGDASQAAAGQISQPAQVTPIPTSELPQQIYTAGGLDPYSGMENMDKQFAAWDKAEGKETKEKREDKDDKNKDGDKKESFFDRRRKKREEKEAAEKREMAKKKAEEERRRRAAIDGAESQMMWGF